MPERRRCRFRSGKREPVWLRPPRVRALMNEAAPPAATMHELLARGAARRGDAAFIVDPGSGRETSYARMHELAVATAAALSRRGLVPGDKVGLVIDNSVELVAAILGALHGGFVAA